MTTRNASFSEVVHASASQLHVDVRVAARTTLDVPSFKYNYIPSPWNFWRRSCAFLKEDKCEENLYFGEGTLEIWLNWEKIGKDSFDDLKHGCLSWI